MRVTLIYGKSYLLITFACPTFCLLGLHSDCALWLHCARLAFAVRSKWVLSGVSVLNWSPKEKGIEGHSKARSRKWEKRGNKRGTHTKN